MGKVKYMVLGRERDPTNKTEGKEIRNKTTTVVCKFLLEDVICQYGCVREIVANKGELSANDAR